jgi:hypothetical protein
MMAAWSLGIQHRRHRSSCKHGKSKYKPLIKHTSNARFPRCILYQGSSIQSIHHHAIYTIQNFPIAKGRKEGRFVSGQSATEMNETPTKLILVSFEKKGTVPRL